MKRSVGSPAAFQAPQCFLFILITITLAGGQGHEIGVMLLPEIDVLAQKAHTHARTHTDTHARTHTHTHTRARS